MVSPTLPFLQKPCIHKATFAFNIDFLYFFSLTNWVFTLCQKKVRRGQHSADKSAACDTSVPLPEDKFPGNDLGMRQRASQVLCVLHPNGDLLRLALALVWHSPGHCSHVGSKSVTAR